MRLSVFNVYVERYPEPSQTLVYNTFSGGFAVLETEELAALRQLDAGRGDDADVDPQLLDSDVGVLVESREAEEQAFRTWFEARRSSPEMSLIVSTTFACNLDCTYCCQSDVLNGKVMSEDTAAHTARWIAERAKEIGAPRIDIDFVGGEPLLQPGRIETLLRVLSEECDTNVTFGLITNGVFLTRELVERWRPLGLRRAQVTLDGDETTHAITRRSKKRGEDTFATTFQNIVDVGHLIDITVRGNYQESTIHGFAPLIAKLRDAGLPPTTRLHFGPALDALGAPTDAAIGSCTIGGAAPEYMIALSDEARRAGFQTGDNMTIGPCSYHQRHHYSIDSDGNLYKCPGFLGHKDWAVGTVSDGLNVRYQRLANLNPQRECGSCNHRPNCAGGCVATEWLRVGRAEGVNCETRYFEEHKHQLVTRKYAFAVTETVEEALATVSPIPMPQQPLRRVSLRVLAA